MRRALLFTLLMLLMFVSSAFAVQYISPLNGANQSIGSSNLLFLDNTNGRVGVGTATLDFVKTNNGQNYAFSSGEAGLTIYNSDLTTSLNSSNTLVLRSQTLSTNHSQGILFVDGNSEQASIRARRINSAINYANNLEFYTSPTASSNFTDQTYQRMVIDYLGNVGIANTNPTYKLDVSGNARFINGIAVSGDAINSSAGLTVSAGAVSLPTDSITSAFILDGTILAADLASDSVASLKIINAAVNSTKLNSTNPAGAGQYLTYGSVGQFTWVTPGAASSGSGWVNTSLVVSLSNAANNISGGTFFVDNTNGRVGVGTSAPTDRFTVGGNVSVVNGSISATPGTPAVIATVSDSNYLDVASAVAIQGRYAYVVSATNDTFTVFDISVPTSPVRISTIGSVGASEFNGAISVIANGRYAYVAAQTSSQVTVVDISNPLSPVAVANITHASSLNNVNNLYLAGKYLYATTQNGDRLAVVDVSKPTAPFIVSTTSADSTNTNDPRGVYVQGKYAYVVSRLNSSGGVSFGFSIFDVSDPTAIIRVSTLLDGTTINDSRGAVYVSGRYAYVGGYSSDSLSVIDVSDPANPVTVSTLHDSTNINGPYSLVVLGKYAYITGEAGDRFTIVDVSNPSSPVIAKSITSGTQLDGARGLAIAGRYAYVAGANDDMFTVVDLGNELPVLSVGSLDASTLYVKDDSNFGGNTIMGGSLNIGGNLITRNGLSTYYDSNASTAGLEQAVNIVVSDNGSVSSGTDTTYGIIANVTRTSPTGGTINTYGGYFSVAGDSGGTSTATGIYSIVSGADTNYAGIFTGGSVGIGTTQPNSTLHVGGTANITGTLYAGGAFSTASTVTASGLITGSNGLTITGTVTLPTGSITTAMIADGAITSPKYVDSSVNSTKFNTSNAGSAGQVLMLNTTGGLNWSSTSAGTVTSVAQAVTGTTAVSVSGSPVTTSGTLSLAFVNATGSQDGLLKSADFTTFTNAAALATALYTNISNLQNSNASAFVAINALNASVISRGNWTQDKPNYALITYVNSAGNWTQDKSSYSTTANSNSMYQARFGVGVANQALIWLNSTNATARLINSTFINTTNTPSSGQYLTYGGSSNGQFTWTTLPASAGNVSSTNGTSGYIARFTNSTNIATGSLYDSGTAVGIGDTTPTNKLDVAGAIGISDTTIIDASRNIVNAGSGTFSGALNANGNIQLPSSGVINFNGGSTYKISGSDGYFDTISTGTTNDPLEINYRTAGPVEICASTGCATMSAYFDTSGRTGLGTTTTDSRLTISGATETVYSAFDEYHDVVSYDYSGGSISGTAEIVLPKLQSSTMLTILIKGYDYSANSAWEIVVSGYPYNGDTNWYNYAAHVVYGTPPFTSVRLGNDGSKNVILLGTTGTSWSYPKIEVSEVLAGHTTYSGWGSGWSINMISSEAGITVTQTPTFPEYKTSGGSVGIGTTGPSQTLDVNGNIRNRGGSFTDSADTTRLGFSSGNVIVTVG